MADISMDWSGDLATSPTGDLALIDGSALGTARVLRRLLTNPGDYIWNPQYGAGLAQFLGEPVSPAGIEALIAAQMEFESAVSHTPEPTITVKSDLLGRLFADIRYVDASTAVSTGLSLNLAS